jgi:hypothetical protein
MIKTGVKASPEDFQKLKALAELGWQQGERLMVFSIEQGIRKDQATAKAILACHQMALSYGLPESPGFYGIDMDGEFITYWKGDKE